MAAPFTPRADRVLKLSLLVLTVAVLAAVWALVAWHRSDVRTGVGAARAQPVDFSHELHAGRLGLDCRFCHVGVDRGAVAGLPTTETCMVCHSRIWVGAAPLTPVRESFATGEPLSWARLHPLPDHVRFHHAIHLERGITCATCHGEVEAMTRTVKARQMTMAWCLDCHRDPDGHAEVPAARPALADGAARPERHGIDAARLTDCSTCHY